MKNCLIIASLAGILCLMGCSTETRTVKWEYKQVPAQITDESLNQLAEQGWSVVCIGSGSGGGNFYVLKRSKR